MEINYDPVVDRVAGVMRCAACWGAGTSFPSLPHTGSWLFSVPLGKRSTLTLRGSGDSRWRGGRRDTCLPVHTQHDNNLIIMVGGNQWILALDSGAVTLLTGREEDGQLEAQCCLVRTWKGTEECFSCWIIFQLPLFSKTNLPIAVSWLSASLFLKWQQ